VGTNGSINVGCGILGEFETSHQHTAAAHGQAEQCGGWVDFVFGGPGHNGGGQGAWIADHTGVLDGDKGDGTIMDGSNGGPSISASQRDDPEAALGHVNS
jgi:hypothetical protein